MLIAAGQAIRLFVCSSLKPGPLDRETHFLAHSRFGKIISGKLSLSLPAGRCCQVRPAAPVTGVTAPVAPATHARPLTDDAAAAAAAASAAAHFLPGRTSGPTMKRTLARNNICESAYNGEIVAL